MVPVENIFMCIIFFSRFSARPSPGGLLLDCASGYLIRLCCLLQPGQVLIKLYIQLLISLF